MHQHIRIQQASVVGRWVLTGFLLGSLLFAMPWTTLATSIVGASIIVATDGEVIVTYQGTSASYSLDLYLASPAGVFPGIIFNNHASPVGSMVNLGTFTAGTELVFRLHVNNTGEDFFTGLASRNPDNLPHARVDDRFSPTATRVEFEDLFGLPEFPGGFNDLSFSSTNVRDRRPRTDVNGDGRADLVWRNSTTGAVAFWLQDGFNVLDARVLATVPLEWQVIGVGDVNGDGRADLVWRHSRTGAVALWLQNGFNVLDARVLATVPLEWHLVGVGDVNGDGKADLIWRNTTTGALALWLQDGFGILDARMLATVPLEWHIVGIGDVNGDGRADLIWWNSLTGAVALWLQNGFSILDAQVLATVPLEWRIVGIGDVNGDGRVDLVWRNTNTGAVALWLQNGFSILDARVLAVVPLEWQIVGVGDVNGDGRVDLVWRNTNTGAVALWLQNGFSTLDAQVLTTVPVEWSLLRGDLNTASVQHALLTGGQEVPPVSGTTAMGTASLTLNDAHTQIDFVLEMTTPLPNMTQAHVHVGSGGTNGPVVFFLCTNLAPPSGVPVPPACPIAPGTLTGTLTAAHLMPQPSVGVTTFAEAVMRLLSGNTYSNVHTSAFPNGEIRGQNVAP